MKGFFKGIGRGIDLLRTILGRLFFLLILGFILFAVFSGPARVTVPDTAALVLAPSGAIVETRGEPDLTTMLLGGAAIQNTLLQDLLDALDRAATDPRITSLVLHLDELLGISPAHLETLEEALLRFRERSGKPVHAYGDYYSQGQYALAAHADSVILHPMGNLMLQGYGGNQLYFRDLLENLSVNMHVFQAGEFKAAAEPWERMDMSQEARENNQQLVDELWARYVERLSAARDIPSDRILAYANDFPQLVENSGGDLARVAVEQGLVDELADQESVRCQMMSRVGERNGTFSQVHFRDYLLDTFDPMPATSSNRIAVWTAEGTIVPGSQPGAVISEDRAMQLLREVRADDSIRALVVRINSPGGGMLASEAIRSELARIQAEGRPVVVSMGATAASGGYWIASTADEIWALPTTITGSIGVVGLLPTFENALDRIGVGVDGVGTTSLSRGGDPLGGLSEEMEGILARNIEDAYRRFIEVVADGRDLSVDEVEALAQGRVLSGSQALEAGLVDALGSLPEAMEAAAALAGVTDWQRHDLRPARSMTEQLLLQLLENVDPAPAMRALTGLPFGNVGLEPVWQPLLEVLSTRGNQPGRMQKMLICDGCNLTL